MSRATATAGFAALLLIAIAGTGCDAPKKSRSRKMSAVATPAPASFDAVPETVPVVPLRDGVLFPNGRMTLRVGREATVAAVRKALEGDGLVGIVTQHSAHDETPGPNELYEMGTLAHAGELTPVDGNYSVIVDGRARFQVKGWTQTKPYLVARIQAIAEVPLRPEELALAVEDLRQLKRSMRDAMSTRPGAEPDKLDWIEGLEDPGAAADLAIANAAMPISRRQELLGVGSVRERLTAAMDAFGPPRLRTRPRR